jgi:hypothetical protein
MKRNVLLAAATASGALLLMSAAQADPLISIGLQEAGVNGGAITTVASGTGAAGVFNLSYGTFTANNISGIGNPPLANPSVLDSSSMNVAADATGTLTVYVSETGITAPAPTGLAEFISAFTENMLMGPITVTESTYLDAANGLYALTTPLGGTTFPPLPIGQPVVQTATADAGAGPYSVTAVYQIAASGVGSDNATIDVSVPEPASLALFGTALLGLAWFDRRRRGRPAG